MFKLRVKLPTTLEEFDTLVERVVKKYELTDTHHAAAIISVAIRHLPNDQAYTTLDYLGQSVLKNLANFVANHKGTILRHEGEVDQLVGILQNDPNDAQARDGLIKAANEGSEYAKKALDKIEPASLGIIAG